MWQASSMPFSRRAQREQLGRVAHCLAQRRTPTRSRSSRRASIFEKSRMSLMIARSASADDLTVVEVFLLFGRQPRLQRQRRHPEDGVERRADLVAHVGEERALGVGRFLGSRFASSSSLTSCASRAACSSSSLLADLEIARVAGQRLLGGLALGDVARRGVDDLLLRKRRRRPQQPADRAVLVEVAILEVDDLFAVAELSAPRRVAAAIVGMDEVDDTAATAAPLRCSRASAATRD